MYEHYFGFSDLPFRLTPDPRYFYRNSIYQEALASLRYGVEARKGFIVITGEVGTGKTTLLKLFLGSAAPNVHSALLLNPSFGFIELLRLILQDLGVPHPSTRDKFILMEHLNRYLIEQLERDHIVALLFDEAQSLSDDVLEELRLFSNVETDRHKLVQIVLIGQPELEARLEQPRLRQIKQRIALRCSLDPLRSYEVERYIDFRIKTAGHRGAPLFDRPAIERIALYSNGIPRLINVICDNALRLACGLSKPAVSAEIVEHAARELQLALPDEKPPAPVTDGRDAPREEPNPQDMPAVIDRGLRWPGILPARGIAFGALCLLALVFAGLAYVREQGKNTAETVRATRAQANLGPAESKTRSAPLQRTDELEPKEAPRPSEDTERAPELRGTEGRTRPQEPAAVVNSRQERFYTGHFKVTDRSILLSKPQRRSEVVTALPRGAQVRVESKNGSYLRVRSMDNPGLVGYVHLDDARLERISDPRRRSSGSRLRSERSDSIALGRSLRSLVDRLKEDHVAPPRPQTRNYEWE
ncbi:MAG TPA: AAA family ATPase [Candidatus Eisenbacteria bacterium]|nr:AAA family ATPase [Candidatus Eisenbacteria bacterium]